MRPIAIAAIVLAQAALGADRVAPAPPPQIAKQVDLRAFREAAAKARAALDAGDFVEASAAYSKAAEADPSSAPAFYNRGVAQYRAGTFEQAAESFAASAQLADATLAAASMFNEGNAIYAQALAQMPEGAPPEAAAAPQADLGQAIEQVKKALTHYKDAAAADAGDVDARVNGETAYRLLKKLEEKKKEQDDKKEQEKQEQEKQDQEKQDQQPENQPQDGQQEQPKDQAQDGDDPKNQEKSQKNSDQSKADARAKKPTPKDDATEQSQEQSQEQVQEEAQQKEQDRKQEAAAEAREEAPADGKEEPKDSKAGELVKGAPLSKEQAEKILQGVRDREKARQDARDSAQRSRQAPAQKDW
ncbi:MAG: tetratricopeptide repeat protein [Phycisphaerales bacterium]|nr:tetratricopeptide repeat protein [Phycisphaerales bacterium]